MPRTPTSRPLTELGLIAALRGQTVGKSRRVRLGIGDDCAILAPPPGHEILVTTDFSLENRHFRRLPSPGWHPPHSTGHRTLARGLSDIAAMGGTPLAAFLSIALPRAVARKPLWINHFLDGLLALAGAHDIPLAGGDTAESPSEHILADIIVIGSAPSGRALRRSGAHPGDLLYVTGSLGGSATELAALAAFPQRFRKPSSADDNPHLYPQARLTVGQTLLCRRLATACIDISDGLSTDLAHLCDESGVSAEVDAALLPLHPLTRSLAPNQALDNALHGGEDYELLFTARRSTRIPRSIAGVSVTPIGRILPVRKGVRQVTLVEASGSARARRVALKPLGWQHLK